MSNNYWQNGSNLPTLYSPPYDPTGRVIYGRSHPGQPSRPLNMQNNQSRLYQNRNLAVKKLEGPDWGMFLGGMIVGGIIMLLFATTTGRKLLCAAGRKVERRLSR